LEIGIYLGFGAWNLLIIIYQGLLLSCLHPGRREVIQTYPHQKF
jgi:hypothetical protein